MSRSLLVVCLLTTLTPCWAQDGGDPFDAPATSDPFGGSATSASQTSDDPFGDSATSASKGDDPFGGSATSASQTSDDPFGDSATSASKGDDPFGGSATSASKGDDPFGAPAPTKKESQTPPGVKPAAAGPAWKPLFPSIAVELPAARAVRARIERELASMTEFEYLDQPLRDVADDISSQHDIPIVLDVRALEDFGIGTDTPVTVSIRGVTLRSALRLVLRDLDLTYAIRDEVLRITTIEDAQSKPTTKLYQIEDLLPPQGDPQYLIDLLQTRVSPDSWDVVGGVGSIEYVEHLEILVVSQTDDVYPEIDNLLRTLLDLSQGKVPQ